MSYFTIKIVINHVKCITANKEGCVFFLFKKSIMILKFCIPKYWKNILLVAIVIIGFSAVACAMECSEDDVNPAFKAICDIIIFLQGRATRAMASLTIMMSAWGIMSGGKINWQELLQMAIGFGLFFFPKTLALFVLPSTVSGISGGQFNPSTVYTPDEILTCICKAIM